MAALRTILFALGLPVLLGACAGNRAHGPESPYYGYPGGLKIDLIRTLSIPPGEATVRLQHGRTVARNSVEETEPWCVFELDTVTDRGQTVQPDSFRVTRIQRRVETFAGMPVVGWQVAGSAFGRDDRPTNIYYITEFRLQSDTQPQVRTLACQSNQAGSPIARHLTLAEMRRALAGYFVLDLARE